MKIFISYRHDEAIAADANLVRDRLAHEFGESAVFLDTRTLTPGEAFPNTLQEQLRKCALVLVLIDPRWLATSARLHEPEDWVRRELEIALGRLQREGIRVIPLLAQGARMPDVALLPQSIAALASLNAVALRGSTLDDDLAALVHKIKGWTPQDLMQWMKARRQATAASIVGVLVLVLGSVVALLDALTLDTRLEALTLAGSEWMVPPQPDPRVLSAVIDAATVRALGKPFDTSWRAQHAQLIRNATRGGIQCVCQFPTYCRFHLV